MLKDANIDTPAGLAPYLPHVTEVTEDNPAADQLIDAITADNPERYHLVITVLRKDREKYLHTGFDIFPRGTQQALGSFLEQWIQLERRLKEITGSDPSRFRSTLLQAPLERFGIDSATVAEIYELRKLRDLVVHGYGLPSESDILSAARRIGSILHKLPEGPGKQ
jgi:hypothetical protein